jgi:drug/metabolite transporter (DMT)-like permease
MNENASQTLPIMLNLIAAVLGAVGQWFYKIGGKQLGIIPIFKNWQLFIGMVLFCIVMVLFVYAFKLGGRLSVVYPVYATTFVWGMLIAINLDHEPWAWSQVMGVAFVVLGVSVIAFSYPK